MELLREASLALGPATVQQLSHEVFPKRHWGVMAESETFAHLEHLVHAGEAERWEEGGVLHVPRRRGRRDDATTTRRSPTKSVDLLAQLIRNQCVNDGTPDSGYESRSADVLAQYLGDTGLDLERYTRAPGPREPRRAHRGQRPDRADAAADGPHRRRARERRRLAARPVRRRARRRRGVGPRRGRHAQPHRDDGGRVPQPRALGLHAARHARVPRGRRRGEPRHVGRGAPAASTSATR